MTKEYVDIVDKQDKNTGITVDITSVHDKLQLHRVASVLLFRPNGKLIIQVHKNHGRRFDHSVGGHVSSGEDYLTAARREMLEELGLDVGIEQVAKGVFSDEYYPKDQNRVHHIFGVFYGKVPNDWELEETEEVDRVVEMTIDEVVELMNSQPERFLQGFMTSLASYLKQIGSPLKINAYGRNWGEF